MRALPRLAVSSGSACTSTAVEPSYVLRALGLSEARARSSLRLAVGRFNTAAEIDQAVEELATQVGRLRREGGAEAESRRVISVRWGQDVMATRQLIGKG